jgi:DNA-binding NarL/FixJ family response regulator
MDMATVVLSDDHPMVLYGLRAIIHDAPDLELVGEATNGAETVELISRLHPDLLVLDILLPDINGIDLIEQLDIQDRTSVVIFSMHANDSYVRAALLAGASSFVLKDAPASELLHAMREAIAGRRYLSPTITDRAVDMFLHHGEAPANSQLEMLTARERQILHLVAAGSTSSAIADRLAISPRTVETHRATLCAS